MNFASLQAVRDVRPRALLAAAEVVLVLVLAVQSARLIWIAAAPQVDAVAASAGAPPRDYAVLARFDPFFRQDGGAPPAASAQGFRLFGVRAGGGGRGSAIIAGPDGRQASVGVGEAVAPGVRLDAVASDHVVLARGGVRSRLYFPDAVSQEVTP